jgi:SAM-dependent methyltransferase
MNYEEVGANIRAVYRDVCPRYREDDEIEVTTQNHRHYCQMLREITTSFDHPISVLDVGCGTGRYFHCLQNVDALTGLDISPEMLKAAESPVRQWEISARQVRLICANAHLASFSSGSFDFIYSLGMFGHGCPVTPDICENFHDWLRPNGRLLFNVVDLATLPIKTRIRRMARKLVEPILPSSVRQALAARRERLPFFGMTRADLTTVMKRSSFSGFDIERHICRSPLWRGVQQECLAVR